MVVALDADRTADPDATLSGRPEAEETGRLQTGGPAISSVDSRRSEVSVGGTKTVARMRYAAESTRLRKIGTSSAARAARDLIAMAENRRRGR